VTAGFFTAIHIHFMVNLRKCIEAKRSLNPLLPTHLARLLLGGLLPVDLRRDMDHNAIRPRKDSATTVLTQPCLTSKKKN
jgi:hypothetical protein